MKFSEFIGESLIVEKNEDKVLQALKKQMQPAIDQAVEIINDKLKVWGYDGQAKITQKQTGSGTEFEVRYELELPKKCRVEDAKSFGDTFHKAFKPISDKVYKISKLPFFKDRWYLSVGELDISGRGPWEFARIVVREETKRGEPSAEDRNLYKDERGFNALKNMLDEIRLYDDGKNLLKLANNAGRIAPEIVKEAKKLAASIKDFKTRAEAEMKKLASQHPDKDIQRYYS